MLISQFILYDALTTYIIGSKPEKDLENHFD